jgi:phosphatidylserine/phosphatidylglycerophosphate/cardiolipin synthase-like enzyme
MNRRTTFFMLFAFWAAAAIGVAAENEIHAYFSPNGGAAPAISKEIEAAKSFVHIAAYAISEPQITAAILAAHERKIDVKIIVDAHEQAGRGSTAARLKKAGIPVVTIRKYDLFHNKYAVIDGYAVITGSMNWTKNGQESNAENTLVIRSESLADLFEADFQKHLKNSSTFKIGPVLLIH